MRHESDRKSERLNLRTNKSQQWLFGAASQAEGTTVTEFVLKYATRAAEDVLADRRIFTIGPEAWQQFNEMLERPERDVPGLRELLSQPTVLDPE
jgi:uncharacterized protein (DUF1778 family)